MLDIRLIREQPDFVKSRLSTRGGFDASAAVEEVLACDLQRRRAETALQQQSAERNRLSKEIGQKRARGEATADAEQQVRGVGEKITSLNKEGGGRGRATALAPSPSAESAARERSDRYRCE